MVGEVAGQRDVYRATIPGCMHPCGAVIEPSDNKLRPDVLLQPAKRVLANRIGLRQRPERTQIRIKKTRLLFAWKGIFNVEKGRLGTALRVPESKAP